MNAQKFRKKPVTIEAMQLTDDLRNHSRVAAHGWVYRLSFPVRHCVTCRCETVTAQEDHE